MNKRRVQATRPGSTTSGFSKEQLRITAPKNLVYPGVAILVFLGITAFVWPHNNEVEPVQADSRPIASLKVQPLELKLQTDIAEEAVEIVEEPALEPVSITVKNGDSMSLVFDRAGLGPSIVHQL